MLAVPEHIRMVLLRYCRVSSMICTILHGLRSLDAQSSVVKTLSSTMGMITMHRLRRKAGGFHGIKSGRRRDLPPVLSMSLMKVAVRRGQHGGRKGTLSSSAYRKVLDRRIDRPWCLVGSGGFKCVSFLHRVTMLEFTSSAESYQPHAILATRLGRQDVMNRPALVSVGGLLN